MLKIKLVIDGKEKEFVEAHANLKHMKACSAFLARVEENLLNSDEMFEESIALVADIFKSDEVNYDSIMEGLAPDDFDETIMNIIFKVVDGETKKKGKATRLTKMEEYAKLMEAQLKEEMTKESTPSEK